MHDTELPLITIGMPVYNNAPYIKAAIQSILAQTYVNWELIILDDGSKDGTLSIVNQMPDSRIRVQAGDRNLGLAARLNQAVALGRGKYFARMDGDDISFPQRLALQVDFLEKHLEVDIVGTGLVTFNDSGNIVGKIPLRQSHNEICRKPWSGFHLAHATWMGKRDWFLANRYNSNLRRAEDQDLLLRTYKYSHFAALPEVCYGYRVNELSVHKAIRERFYLLSSLLQYGKLHNNYSFIVKATVGQVAKGIIDTIAIGTGLNYRLLRHRALPIDQKLLDEWRLIGAACCNNIADTPTNDTR